MRRLSILLVASALALAIPGAAGAALLFWDGTNKLQLGSTNEVVTPGSGVATVNGSSGLGNLNTFRVATGALSNTYTVFLSDPNVPTVNTLSIVGQMGAGTLKTIYGGGPLTMNTLPIAGRAKLCLVLAGCNAWLEIPLTEDGNRGVGIGGIITQNGFGAGLRISVRGAPWTVATAKLTGAFTGNAMIPNPSRATETRTNLTGFAHGPGSSTSSTAQIGGALQIVTASFVGTTLMTPSNHIVLWSETRYVFVPEPGLVLLLASGVAGLALLGRHRLRR